MKCKVSVRARRGNGSSHTHALFACSVTADKQTLSRGGVKHLSEAPPSPNRTSTEASGGMEKAIKCGGGGAVHSGVPGHGQQAGGSNERVEEKKRGERQTRAPRVPWWLGTAEQRLKRLQIFILTIYSFVVGDLPP